ncbi:CapA family protein [Dehalococcoidia bacterium]|nr:CapA family protein [Dehalococcoidia bacterium]
MLYESESGNIRMALTGESLITRGMSLFQENRFLGLRDLLRNAEVVFTNLEMLFHNYETPPTHHPGGTYMRCDPRFIKDLQWLGINIVGCANNHCYDFGENGVLANIQYLDAAGLAHAGTGRHLAEATAPTYIDTPNGRVALIAATSSGPPGLRAGEQRRDIMGRPGANMIRWTTEWTVDKLAFDALCRISHEMGWPEEISSLNNSGYSIPIEDSGSTVHLLDQPQYGEETASRFIEGETFERHTVINQADLERNLQRVADARRMADWVLFTVHNHEGGKAPGEPSDHIKTLAHAVIDAGADVFIGHGPHQDRGIEVYNSKPILYSLGDFILQNDTVLLMPHDNLLKYDLGWEATPADFYDARSVNESRGQTVQPIRWESAVAMVTFKDKQMQDLRLYPIDLGFGRPRPQRGRPLLAEGDVSQVILERFQQLSAPFGTRITIEDGVGIIQIG